MMGNYQFRPSHWLIGIFAVLMTLIAACRSNTEEPIVLIPANQGPGIAVLSPSDTRLLRMPGDAASVTLKILDNEELRLLRIVREIYDASDALVEETIPTDIDLTGTQIEYTYNFTVPNLPAFYKVRYLCYVIDAAGLSAKTFFWVSIQPDPSDPPPYQILTYTNDTLYNGLDTEANPQNPDDLPTNSWGFNFSSRKVLPGEPFLNPELFLPQMDIAENSGSGVGQEGWIPSLYSPNHVITGDDTAIFVITDESRFNYEEANYNTIYRAFFSDPAPAPTAPPTNHPIDSKNTFGIQIGDIVIVKLIKTPRPQFAVMKITDIVQEGFGLQKSDYFVFNYKVTSP